MSILKSITVIKTDKQVIEYKAESDVTLQTIKNRWESDAKILNRKTDNNPILEDGDIILIKPSVDGELTNQ